MATDERESKEQVTVKRFDIRVLLKRLIPEPMDEESKPWQSIKDPAIREAVAGMAKERSAYKEGWNKCQEKLMDRLTSLLDETDTKVWEELGDARLTAKDVSLIVEVADKALRKGIYETSDEKDAVVEWVKFFKSRLIQVLSARAEQSKKLKEEKGEDDTTTKKEDSDA